MNSDKLVNKLDILRELKQNGTISEEEYEKQSKKIEKDYINNHNPYVRRSIDISLQQFTGILVIVFLIIAVYWFFSSGLINSIQKAGKDFVAIFKNDSNNNVIINNDNSKSKSSDSVIYKTKSSAPSSYKTDTSDKSTSSKTSKSTSTSKTSKSSYKASCKNYDSKYDDMRRNPKSYKGKKMKFIGDVEQRWSKNGSLASFTMSACTSDSRHIGMVYCTIDKSVLNGGNLLQYDRITVYGEFKGLTDKLYSIYGFADYPSIEVKYIEFTQR